ncbi:MAG: tripartite tricarboxylate transporter substrate binding protein [Burkholderiaceae bacterium]
MRTLITRTVAACIAAAALAWQPPAGAQDDYPTRQPIRLIVTFAPGGGADTIARSLNVALGEQLKQNVLVENRPGAGGTIATEYVAKSPPDGYTVLFTVSSHSINQALYPKLNFDTERDLRGVSLIGELPQVLVANPQVPADSLAALLKLAGDDAAYRSVATGGAGSPGHFALAMLQARTQVPFVHVPYRGSGPAISDVVGNQVPLLLSTLSGTLPHIKSGKLKAIALTSPRRSPLLPDVPTIAESGLPGYNMDTWVGMFVPRATPDSVVDALHAATRAALRSPAVLERIRSQAGTIVNADGRQLDERVHAEIIQFTDLVARNGIRAE